MTDFNGRLTLYGVNGSPYSCKIRSYLRYKRIPFDWTYPKFLMMEKWPKKFAHIKAKVIPVVEWPDGFSMNESTKIIQKIETDINNRSVIPTNKCHAFLCDLLEDFADEWGTKLFFAMRFNRKIDYDFYAKYFSQQGVPFKMRKYFENTFKKRMRGRTKLVGCDNDEIIHASFHEICGIFETYLSSQSNIFFFGNNPTNADFAFYGQMYNFRTDMTPDSLLRERYQLLLQWLDQCDDLSGIEYKNEFKISDIVMDLLKVCGNVYMPFLKANSDAIASGKGKKDMFEVDIVMNGKRYTHKQAPFKWQQRCLMTLRKKLNGLRNDEGFKNLKSILQETNCWEVLNDNSNPSKL
eukprot:209104_1